MGNYFCYDYPACLEGEIELEFDVSAAKYGYLYSVYAIPNLILPLFGGILFDKYGNRVCLMWFTSLLMLGQGIFTFGGYKMKYWVMLLGRAVFGIGSESMYVGQASIVSDWFMNYEMPLAMAMTSCIPLCGSFIGGSIIPRVYYHNAEDLDVSQQFGNSFLIGLLVSIFSLCTMITIYFLDRISEEHDTKLLNEMKGIHTSQVSKGKDKKSNVEDTLYSNCEAET